MGEVTFTTTFEDGESKSVTATIFDELKFTAQFRRLDTYKGEFGFDWMRDEYKPESEGGKGVSLNYTELKKEYTPDTINEKEYFVPWLSMFPNQENVKLKLKIDTILGEATGTDVIKLPSKNGVKFNPDSVKVNEVSETEILVTCETPINEDFDIELLDKNNNKIGKINILKNNKELELPIRFVKVIDTNNTLKINDRVFGETSNKELEETKEYINKKGLNQVLIKPDFKDSNYTSVREIDFNFRELENKGWVKYLSETSSQPHFTDSKSKGELRDLFKSTYETKFEKFKGIIIFITIIAPEGREAGFSWTIPRKNNVVLISNGFFDGHTFLHEISHALGLEHPFSKGKTSNIETVRKNIEANLSNIENNQDAYDKYKDKSDNVKINFTNGTVSSVKNYKEKCLSAIEENQKKLKKNKAKLDDYLAVSNKYFFNKATTENIMDYDYDEETRLENPNELDNTYHKYQINLVQEVLNIILT